MYQEGVPNFGGLDILLCADCNRGAESALSLLSWRFRALSDLGQALEGFSPQVFCHQIHQDVCPCRLPYLSPFRLGACALHVNLLGNHIC